MFISNVLFFSSSSSCQMVTSNRDRTSTGSQEPISPPFQSHQALPPHTSTTHCSEHCASVSPINPAIKQQRLSHTTPLAPTFNSANITPPLSISTTPQSSNASMAQPSTITPPPCYHETSHSGVAQDLCLSVGAVDVKKRLFDSPSLSKKPMEPDSVEFITPSSQSQSPAQSQPQPSQSPAPAPSPSSTAPPSRSFLARLRNTSQSVASPARAASAGHDESAEMLVLTNQGANVSSVQSSQAFPIPPISHLQQSKNLSPVRDHGSFPQPPPRSTIVAADSSARQGNAGSATDDTFKSDRAHATSSHSKQSLSTTANSDVAQQQYYPHPQ
jgi:hypothetical protein